MRRTTALLLALLGVVACSPQEGEPLSELRAMAVQPPELGMAEAVTVQKCLRRKGFDAPLPRPYSGGVANIPRPITEVDAQRGYGPWVNRQSPGEEPDPLGRYRQRLPASQQDAFARAVSDTDGPTTQVTTPNGRTMAAPRAGCVAEGRTAVYGSVQNWLLLYYAPQDLNVVAAEMYLQKPVGDAITTYRACMSTRGHQVQYPQEPMEMAKELAVGTAEASAAEISLARADAACQSESKVVERYLDALAENSRSWAAKNADVVRKSGKIVRDSLDRAGRV